MAGRQVCKASVVVDSRPYRSWTSILRAVQGSDSSIRLDHTSSTPNLVLLPTSIVFLWGHRREDRFLYGIGGMQYLSRKRMIFTYRLLRSYEAEVSTYGNQSELKVCNKR